MPNASTTTTNGVPLYMRNGGDPQSRISSEEYFPAWVNNLADDAILEGSMINGTIHGTEDIRTVVTTIRSLYDFQEFNFTGPYRETGWTEDYIAQVKGEPLGCIVVVTTNPAGQAQHVIASYRPFDTVVLFSRLLREQLAGTSLENYFTPHAS
jgi:hypothetical protein